MAHLIPLDGPMEHGIPTPLSITALQGYVEGFVEFIDLEGGDCMAVHEDSQNFADTNITASILAKQAICGNAVLFHTGELE